MQRDLEWVRSFVRRHLDSGIRRLEDTGDVVQEVMLAVLSKGQHFVVADKVDFRALIGTMVLNHVRSSARYQHAARRDTRRERTGLTESVLYLRKDAPAKCVTRPDQKAELEEGVALVRLARELIDPESREILEMRDDEMSFLAIGERLGCQEDAARKRHKAAILRLQDFVQKLRSGRLGDIVGS